MARRPKAPQNLPDDDHRCTIIDDNHGRCKLTKLPDTPFCRIHFLADLNTISSTPIATPKPSKKRPRAASPEKKQPTIMPDDDDRCRRSDGRAWRCRHPRLPGIVFCKNHHQRKMAIKKPITPSASLAENPIAKVENPEALSFPKAMEAEILCAFEKGEVGEIWALAQTPGDLPRSYARIDRILGRLVEVTPLIAHPFSDEEIGWIQNGLTLVCGTFRAGNTTAVKEISVFSHRANWSKVGKGDVEARSRSFFKIFPGVGEVWAVYSELGNGLRHHLVEIVAGSTNGVTVARLEALEGKGDELRRWLQEGYEMRRDFSRKEMVWFSHRVPAVKMGEDEGLWRVALG